MASLNYRGDSPLGYKNAYHLLRRTTYKVTKERIEEFSTKNANQALNILFNYDSFSLDDLIHEVPKDKDGVTLVDDQAENFSTTPVAHYGYFLSWYLNEAYNCDTIRFKMAFFLHSIFVNNFPNTTKTAYDQIKLFLYYSKESYKKLAEKITYDNRMLVYLNGNSNIASNPNENYAREFLELFTITKGNQTGSGTYDNYTEEDVITAKYVFTGFKVDYTRSTIDPQTLIPRGKIIPNLHNSGPKTFSDRFGGVTIQGGNDIPSIQQEFRNFVTMVFNQDATAIALAERLYRFFVHREISTEVKNDIIIPLAQYIKETNYNLRRAVRKLLSSLHFYDEDNTIGEQNFGALIKTPIDLFLQSINLFKITVPSAETERLNNHRFFLNFMYFKYLKNVGLDLFRPFTVAGYPPIYQEPDYDKQWLTVNTISYRYGLGQSFIEGRDRVSGGGVIIPSRFNALEFIRNSGYFNSILDSLYADPFANASTAMPELMQKIEDIAFTMPLSDERRNEIYNDFLLGNLSEINWAMEWKNYVDGVTNGADIKVSINNVFYAILNSPEYQIM